MSYEGYEIWLCCNGHMSEFDCYMTPDRSAWACPVAGCGLPLAWFGDVDQTNGEGKRPRLKIATPRQTKRCNHCGVESVVAPETYVIPKGKKS